MIGDLTIELPGQGLALLLVMAEPPREIRWTQLLREEDSRALGQAVQSAGEEGQGMEAGERKRGLHLLIQQSLLSGHCVGLQL